MTKLTQKHIPVMLAEVLQYLQPQKGETYVDATFGNGGYSEAILETSDCKVIALFLYLQIKSNYFFRCI